MSAALGIFRKEPDSEPQLVATIEDPVVFGSSSQAHVKVNDLRVSGLHALIENDRGLGQPVLIDLGSRFGTYVGRKRISERPLELGESFSLGKHAFYVAEVTGEFELPVKVQNEPSGEDDQVKKQVRLVSEHNLLEGSLFWGEKLLEVKTFEPNSVITLGPQRNATFPVAFDQLESNAEPFLFGEYRDGQLHLHLPVAATGLVWSGDEIVSVDALRHRDKTNTEFGDIELKIRVGDRAQIQFGELALLFRFVEPNGKGSTLLLPKPDRILLRTTLIMGAVFLALFAILSLLPTPEREQTLEDIPEHLKQVLYDAGIEEALKKQQSAIGQIAKAIEGGRARSEEGQATAKRAPKKPTPKKEAKQKQESQQQDNSPAPALDLDAAFNVASEAQEVKNVDMVGESNSGNTASAVLNSGFARGAKGLGAGGGGQSVGIGALKGYGTGGGMGAGDFGLAPSKGRAIKNQIVDEVLVLGGLDPEIIAEIIRRYLPQIQNCYEQQLTLKPNLKGKVTSSFIIGPNGTVKKVSISETTLRDAATEKCIAERISTWVFPKPKGGGTVGVKYPFLLMSNSGS